MESWRWSTIAALILTGLGLVSDLSAGGGPVIDVHELLPEYGLPKGLLPDNVEWYRLAGDGSFTVELRSECYVHFGDNYVYYGTHIEGKLGQGTVTGVSGIESKKLFLWVPITSIVAHPEDRTVEFRVGPLSETLSVSLFEDVPVCKSKLTQSI